MNFDNKFQGPERANAPVPAKPVTEKLSGGNVNYYLVVVNHPKRLVPYQAEAEDIIEALGMTFAEGCAFKALWRSCAARTLGVVKEGADANGVYDAEKIVYYGNRILVQRKLKDTKK